MKTRILLSLVVLLGLVTGACSDSADRQTAKELLTTIPGDAAYAAVVNTDALVKSTGGDVEDKTGVKPSVTLRKFLNQLNGTQGPAHLDSLFAGKGGIEFSCFALFENSGNLWLTAPLADSKLTKAYFSRHGYNLQDAGEGLLCARDIVFDDSHIWVSLKDSMANAADVSAFRRLNKEQSLASSGYAERLTALESDYIDLWDSNILWRTLGPSAGKARMISAFMFEDAKYASFSADMTEKMLIATGSFLNSDFKEAKCNLATSKLATRDFNILGDKAQAVAGLSIDSKLIKNVIKAAGVFGAALPPSTEKALESIEGPLVAASDEDNNLIFSIPCRKGMEQNVVNAVEGLTMLLGDVPSMRMTTKEGAVLISINGGPQAGKPIAQLGEKLDGAWLGLAFTAGYFPKAEPVKDFSVALIPTRSSLEFRIRIDY